ncbi:MAG: cytochrome P450 [Janthinobacterium lividum]
MEEQVGNTPLDTAPLLDIDPYAVDVLLNPHPFFEQLRETAAVVQLKPYGVYAVGRHDEAVRVLTDHEFFTTTGGVGLFDIRKPGIHRPANPILERDPPDHTVIRRTITQIISPLVIRSWRERFENEARLIVDDVLARGSIDGVENIAEAFVMNAFASVLGVDMPRDATLAISEMSFNRAGPFNELRAASEIRAEPYIEWYSHHVKRDAMKPGSVGMQLYEAEDKGLLPTGTAEATCRLLIRAGTDTTIAGIGFTLNQLAQHPDQFELVKQDLNRVKDAFEEAIRHESPSYTNFRTTTQAVELSGFALEADTKIAVFLGAAGRDPRKWPDADRYDVLRRPAGTHLAFGVGTHVCIGQMIARLESECILKALLARIDSLQLDGEPTFRAINQLRTLDRLPLRLKAA